MTPLLFHIQPERIEFLSRKRPDSGARKFDATGRFVWIYLRRVRGIIGSDHEMHPLQWYQS
jgi:hypothetical protein